MLELHNVVIPNKCMWVIVFKTTASNMHCEVKPIVAYSTCKTLPFCKDITKGCLRVQPNGNTDEDWNLKPKWTILLKEV